MTNDAAAAEPPRDADARALEVRTAQIRVLNDALRIHRAGGSILITSGIAALGLDGVEDALAAVAAFDAFDTDNDPYGLHDCGVFVIGGVRVLWLIDSYDHHRTGRSPDAADPRRTWRVLTVMRADEY